MKQDLTEQAIKRWDRFADQYAGMHFEQGDVHKEIFLTPEITKLLGDVEGLKILDAGCGEGYFSRILANAGAEVTAVDYSERMLEIAKERSPDRLDITYVHGNCERLTDLEDERFEAVVSNMVLQDLADYEQALAEIHRVLKPGGRFVFSILHPCFITPESGWENTDQGDKLHWNVDKYFYEGMYEQKLGGEERMMLFHRTLTSYVQAVLAAGFTIEGIIEPKPSEDMLVKYPSFREDFRCADFMIFHLKK